jgi:transcriptional regulator GlxA family with amidase domain
MSERNFLRKFREDIGQSPAEYVLSARLEAACRFLTETEFSLKGVAQRCGFGSVTAMRRAFLARVGVPPKRYRDNFQMKS